MDLYCELIVLHVRNDRVPQCHLHAYCRTRRRPRLDELPGPFHALYYCHAAAAGDFDLRAADARERETKSDRERGREAGEAADRQLRPLPARESRSRPARRPEREDQWLEDTVDTMHAIDEKWINDRARRQQQPRAIN